MDRDILYEIMMKTDYQDLKELCRVNKEASKICASEQFWENKYKQDHEFPCRIPARYSKASATIGTFEDKVANWKTEYKLEYVRNRPKKLYSLIKSYEYDDNEVCLNIRAHDKEEVYKFIAHWCNYSTDETMARGLVHRYIVSEILEPNTLNLLWEKYEAKGSLTGDLIRKAVKLCYLKPQYLYYADGHREDYLKFFKYLYEKGYCVDLITEKFPDKIDIPYFTSEEVKTMLNLDEGEEITGCVHLIEKECYEI